MNRYRERKERKVAEYKKCQKMTELLERIRRGADYDERLMAIDSS